MKKFAIIVGCILYVLSPIDFIPDFFPVIGQLDDLTVIVLGVRALMKNDDDKPSLT